LVSFHGATISEVHAAEARLPFAAKPRCAIIERSADNQQIALAITPTELPTLTVLVGILLNNRQNDATNRRRSP
jgi:hypothetical protein